jgi:membrane-anchored mycosin MYCP
MTTSLRLFAVTMLTAVMAVMPAPYVAAERPPAVDNTFLPPAAAPHPPEPTERQYECTSAVFDPRLNVRATQLSAIDLPALWALTTGEGQKVAVIDTGVSTHPRLARLIAGGDYASTGDGREDCDAHGTMVAGIIAAAADPSPDSAFAGIAPGVSVLTIRQSSAKYRTGKSRASGVGDVDTLAMAVRTAADMGERSARPSHTPSTTRMWSSSRQRATSGRAVPVRSRILHPTPSASTNPIGRPRMSRSARVGMTTTSSPLHQ